MSGYVAEHIAHRRIKKRHLVLKISKFLSVVCNIIVDKLHTTQKFFKHACFQYWSVLVTGPPLGWKFTLIENGNFFVKIIKLPFT